MQFRDVGFGVSCTRVHVLELQDVDYGSGEQSLVLRV